MNQTSTAGIIPDDRTALLVDGQALFMLAKRAHMKPDMKKLREWLQDRTGLSMCIYHQMVHVDDTGQIKRKPYLDFLRHDGWQVHYKSTKPVTFGAGDKPDDIYDMSLSLCSSIATLMMGGKIEQIIVVSNNPKLSDMYQVARSHGLRIVVMSSTVLGLAPDSSTANGDGFVEFTEVMNSFCKPEYSAAEAA